MKIKKKTFVIPQWAIPYLENGDRSWLLKNEIKTIESWKAHVGFRSLLSVEEELQSSSPAFATLDNENCLVSCARCIMNVEKKKDPSYSYLIAERFDSNSLRLNGKTFRYIQIASSFQKALDMALEMIKCHFGDTEYDLCYKKEAEEDLKSLHEYNEYISEYCVKIIKMEVNSDLAEIL